MSDFVIENGVLTKYTGPGGDVVIPDGTIGIGKYTFWRCASLTSISIPDSITEIGMSTFWGCANLQSVTLPASITNIGHAAFSGCESLNVIHVDEKNVNYVTDSYGVLFDKKQCTLLWAPVTIADGYVIPDSVTRIDEGAFEYCINLSKITIPNGVKKIDSRAFCGCTGLVSIAVPNSVTDIGCHAFYDCSNLTHITLPDGIKKIAKEAFHGCRGLTSIDIPECVKEIEERAFYGCHNLSVVTLPDSAVHICQGAFHYCHNLRKLTVPAGAVSGFIASAFPETTKIFFPENVLKARVKLSSSILAHLNGTYDTEDYIHILAYQSGAAWLKILKESNCKPTYLLKRAMELLGESPRSAAQFSGIVDYAKAMLDQLAREDIVELVDYLQKVNPASAKKIADIRDVKLLLQTMKEHGIEPYVRQLIQKEPIDQQIMLMVKKGLPYADGSGDSTCEAVAYIINAYAKLYWENAEERMGEVSSVSILKKVENLHPVAEADIVAAALDRKTLQKFLAEKCEDARYRSFLLAYVRYASDEDMNGFVAKISSRTRGKAKDRYWAENATQALFLSETIPAMLYLDKVSLLEKYAKLRGTTAQDLLDMQTLPDVGFDPDGVKHYDIGGTILEVRITAKLELQLTDSNGKVLRSFPKKSADPEKLSACAEDYTALKKTVTEFLKTRVELLRKLYITEQTVSENAWNNAYMTHPLLKAVAMMLIWDDGGTRFVVRPDGPKTVSGESYVVTGPVCLAHVLDMPKQEVDAWQHYLTNNQITLLVEQVWEPLADLSGDLSGRYTDQTISSAERNSMKKNLKSRGIEVRSENDGAEFDHRNWRYDFSNTGRMFFGNCMSIAYEVDDATKAVTFRRNASVARNKSRALNAVVFELDRATIRSAIVRGEDQRLNTKILDTFTTAQIQEFTDLAVESNSTGCSALLLEYKQTHFPDADPMDTFVLEW